MKFCYVLGIWGNLMVGGLTQAAGQSPAPATFRNPIRPDGPDPWIVYHAGQYYYTNTTGNNLTLWKAAKLSEVGRGEGRVVWTPPAAGPNSHDIWAPELHRLQGKWYLYYTATDKANPGDQTRYVFVLENASADPTTGTWTDKGRVPTRYSGLDGTVFEHQGQAYFAYSAYVGPQSVLCLAPLRNPWTPDVEREVILARPTHAWEKGGGRQILEGPEFLAGPRGQLFIVYSASACWDDNYCLGLLTAPAGADLLRAELWTKTPEPVFRSSKAAGVYGPGHNGFTTSPDGRENWLVYHAKTAADGKCAGRSSRLQRFGWRPDGTPDFSEPTPLTTPQPRPAGE
ncbi:glycoside hydrolase family 43 protein [Hymenobacter weizhouensis]|uniref:glycoside hydrolase family 43 protein n=1 Tax=Hymenobacter sp. YIM 151500-1 TaxID=2987689 RepID=UPI002227CAD9|nr:glycoside hydrolase family 43 protein [Hymenobacter sp. YIM 151500-1]UYZ62098.1 glycoside hydrolase family 43 protein [Hymenobacter sp. YIM 151500-1]